MANNGQKVKVHPQGVASLLFNFLPLVSHSGYQSISIIYYIWVSHFLFSIVYVEMSQLICCLTGIYIILVYT